MPSQILQLGAVQGAANFVSVQVVGSGSAALALPAEFTGLGVFGTSGQNLLIQETGQYTIIVSTFENIGQYANPTYTSNNRD